MISTKPFRKHLNSADNLVTPYEATRAGFVAQALEKNRQATPFIQQARALKAAISSVAKPLDLLNMREITASLLVAAGVSDKALAYLQDSDKQDAMTAFIRDYLEPQGNNWGEELVYRFLLTRGDSLGGMMRNMAGALAQRKMTRGLIASLGVLGWDYQYLNSESNSWLAKPINDADIELWVKGLSWRTNTHDRTLIYNIKVPIVNKNVDLCLFDCPASEFASDRVSRVQYKTNKLYLALGELKGGIDPAGADEHWKTANSALQRIERAFREDSHLPLLFYVGAAIERDMAKEIWQQLEAGALANAANLTDENQLASLCLWLCQL